MTDKVLPEATAKVLTLIAADGHEFEIYGYALGAPITYSNGSLYASFPATYPFVSEFLEYLDNIENNVVKTIWHTDEPGLRYLVKVLAEFDTEVSVADIGTIVTEEGVPLITLDFTYTEE